MGENGAGKSTLMNILFGMSVIHETGGYGGAMRLEGRAVKFASPSQAMAAGLGMVHQEFMLLPGLHASPRTSSSTASRRSPTLLSRVLGLGLETLDRARMGSRRPRRARPRRPRRRRVGADGGLPVGHMQFVEIAREVDKRYAKLLIFDEPTAVLTESEATQLLDVMQVLAAAGLGILFITHRLDEVLAVADDITVLRDGEVVAQLEPGRTTVGQIAELMVGRARAAVRHPARRRTRATRRRRSTCTNLEVRHAGRGGPRRDASRSSRARSWGSAGSPGTARSASPTG